MKPLRRLLVLFVLLLLASPLTVHWNHASAEDVYKNRVRKVTFNVGGGGAMVLDSIEVDFPAFIMVHLRSASQVFTCSTFTAEWSQNDTCWTAMPTANGAVFIDSVSNTYLNSASGRTGWWTAATGTHGDGAPGYIPARFLRLSLTRCQKGAADSATTALDTIYVTTRVWKRFH